VISVSKKVNLDARAFRAASIQTVTPNTDYPSHRDEPWLRARSLSLSLGRELTTCGLMTPKAGQSVRLSQNTI